jgi:hypothetical protein
MFKCGVYLQTMDKSIRMLYDKHFENIQAKHTTELISFEIQCFDRIFVDKLFKSVFKSWRFEKHASKSYLKITTNLSINQCIQNK